MNKNIINLSADFAPLGEGIKTKFWNFPDGSFGVKIEEDCPDVVKIVARLNSDNSVVKLLMLTDALRQRRVRHIDLFISYLPYARQDRLCDKGESFSLKVISNLLNAQGYRHVEIFDVHSEVATALISNSISVPNHKFVAKVLENRKDYLLISPDAGAYKKIFQLAAFLDYRDEIVCCNKVRDTTNGQIKKMSVMSETDLKGRECVIVDDIASRGGTFVGLSKELHAKGANKVDLIVSHYENTATAALHSAINHIYCTNSFIDVNNLTFLTQLKLSPDII
jgi:ribose-phosphate pyrophosphokinase